MTATVPGEGFAAGGKSETRDVRELRGGSATDRSGMAFSGRGVCDALRRLPTLRVDRAQRSCRGHMATLPGLRPPAQATVARGATATLAVAHGQAGSRRSARAHEQRLEGRPTPRRGRRRVAWIGVKPVRIGCSGWNYRDWRGGLYP